MPKKNLKIGINLDLLKPQSNPEKLAVKVFRWLLSTGRYIFILVEVIVFIAFILRFKLDADLADKKEAIEQQIPYIESLGPYEILIRQTQLKISTILAAKSDFVNYPLVFKKIADQTPLGIKLISLNMQKEVGKITFTMNAEAQNNNDVTSFVQGLKQDSSFSDINLTSIDLDQRTITFTLTGSSKISKGVNL
ncbi:PilN domain-containing protein [Candidatus Daviesbacteria bacterium]|nr:PilN domain-containing protein [Candidatus Daviesbacteria bacterium]